ncbi:TolB family protein [Reinekea marinisedimentorum]|uniref:WD40 repeat protein n=1 Tax=Reinekea marinisedimentorum TaxID=230495 RepID=A0A4R3IBD5_9GAMM|nr:hypothetical protein [Reinekea marinisedimentorum]TCS43929.1 hypothetical protein BCF53_101272 [Reinekea marinisedimentorum]
MMQTVTRLLLICLTSLLTVCHAQGWQVIDQPMFRVIFPAEIQPEAERVADHLNHYLTNHLADMPLNGGFKRIAVVLHSASHVSNGYVNLAPNDSHWYNKPKDNGVEWFETLAVHEGRHMVQFNQIFDKPSARVLHFLTGQAGSAVIGVVFLPQWFYEGDAVISETTQTEGGRGRMASFDLWFRTATLNEPLPSYEQAMLGTGFDSVPYRSPYLFGYYMTAYLQRTYGADIFDTAIDELLSFDGFNLNGVIKQQTGKNLSQHYRDMMAELKTQWQTEQDELALTEVSELAASTANHWNSLYPIYSQGDASYAVEVDVQDGYFLTEVSQQQRKRLADIPSSVGSQFISSFKTRAVAANGERFCWVDIIPNLTRLYHESGELFCWQAQTGLQQLSKGEKFTGVGMRDHQMLAHRFNTNRSSKLVLLNSEGEPQASISLPVRSLAYDIQPTDDGWVFVLSGSENNGIYFVDAALGSLSQLVATQDELLRSPLLTENWVLFSSDRSGIDQLYASARTTGQRFQIATRPYGAYFSVWNKHNAQLIFADYTAKGQQLAAIEFTDPAVASTDWQPTAPEAKRGFYAEPLVRQYPSTEPLAGSYPVSKFKLSKNLIRPYIWSAGFEGDRIEGIVLSQDVLEKLSLTTRAGYQFDQSDWIGAVAADYRTDVGPHLVLASAKDYEGDDKERLDQISLYQTFNQRFGNTSQSWTPSIGLGSSKTNGEERESVVLGSLSYARSKDTPIQAISSPLGFSQSFSIAHYLEENHNDVMSNSFLTFRAPGRYAAIDLAADLQYLESDNELLVDSTLFDTPDEPGFTTQLSADYRLNLGGLGMNLTHLAYWRNTELSFNARAQISEQRSESAIGFTIAPSLNLLRNSWLQASPALSTYYTFEDTEVRLLITLSVGN